ncbi:MAG: hypothetical protein U5M23_13255 [Marinagarivorans sp.]|nr:hypothetical protein [Marinagarivorans sp.]
MKSSTSELLADAEQTCPTPHPKLRIARSRPVAADLLASLSLWLSESCMNDADVRAGLQRWIPDYVPAIHFPLAHATTDVARAHL